MKQKTKKPAAPKKKKRISTEKAASGRNKSPFKKLLFGEEKPDFTELEAGSTEACLSLLLCKSWPNSNPRVGVGSGFCVRLVKDSACVERGQIRRRAAEISAFQGILKLLG